MFSAFSAKPSDPETRAANLMRSPEFLRSLLEQITQPFTVADEHGGLLLWNHAFEELSGYAACELADMETPELILAEADAGQPIHLAPAAGDEQTCTAELRTKDRQMIPVELRSVRLNSPDGDPVVLTLLANLSERQRLEAELRQSQKMEAIGKLAVGVAHEVNNVLTTMAPTYERLREIHHAGVHAAELTHSLLAFSRRQILQMKNIRLDSGMEDIAKMIGRLIGEDIRLDIFAETNLPPIRADQSQIEQVLLNLCLNARDAMRHGGELRITARTETVTDEWAKQNQGSRPGRYVVLAVRDTGEGMDQETLRHVFEPFFTRKAPGKGTGLGLSMVYGIVKQHDAFIKVSSEVGAGTEFAIYFPPASGDPEPLQPRETAVSERGSATILVVEDEKSVRRLILEVLSNLGYRTFAAANGEEAVKVFERWAGQIDLVLLDAILPKKGAREVYEFIRARKPSVRFVFTSGYNEVFINKKFELDPSFDFLRKPFTTLELATRIRNALE